MKSLILLHGALGHNEIFEPLRTELSKYFTIHTPLFSGHGDVEIPENGITIEKYTQELKEFIEKEKLQNVYIFGHSMGGYVALCYAEQHPSTVHSIMTLGTKFDWTEEQALKESKMLNPDVIAEKVPKYAELLESQHGSKWKQLLPAIAEMMISLGKNPPLKDNLSTIDIPVQIKRDPKNLSLHLIIHLVVLYPLDALYWEVRPILRLAGFCTHVYFPPASPYYLYHQP